MTETSSSSSTSASTVAENQTPYINDVQPDAINQVYKSNILGQVKWFNIKSGFGFITVCKGEEFLDEKDIFVHYSSLDVDNKQYRYLVQGEYVEFDIMKPENDKYELHAVNVSGIRGGQLMCEIRKENNDTRGSFQHESVAPSVIRQSPRPRTPANQYRNEKVAPVADSDDAGFQVVQRGRNRAKKIACRD
jgi:cold shock CspA family protein